MTIKHTSLPRAIVDMTEPQKPRLANRKEMLQAQPRWPERWPAISRVFQRELRLLFHSQAVYIVLSVSLLITGLMLQNCLNFVRDQGLFVTSGTLNALLYAVIILASLLLGLSVFTTAGFELTAGMITDPRGQAADACSYVPGNYLARMTTYLVLATIYGCCLALLAGLANFSLAPDLIWIGLVSVLTISQGVALALFLAPLFSQGQVGRSLFLGIVLSLIVIQFGPKILVSFSSQGVYDQLILSAQYGLAWLRWAVGWVSPYAHLSRGIEAVMIGDLATYLTTLLSAALQTSLLLSLSIVIFRCQEGSK